MRRPYIAANWKMNGSGELCKAFAAVDWSLTGADVVVFPASLHTSLAVSLLCQKGLQIGVQDVHTERAGAFTGEISAEMAREAGASYALAGHSERRTYFDERNEIVAQKYSAALRARLVPVLCVGETLEQRDAGHAEEVVSEQIECVLSLVGTQGFASGLIAYEPVWAIGTGRSASASQANMMHRFIRKRIQRDSAIDADEMRIIYGGSVKKENARDLIMEPDIDGFLVGGASLDAESFVDICECART